jgi:hypothetical protein
MRERVSDVEEMIQNRFEAHSEEVRCEDDGLWPREFWLEESLLSDQAPSIFFGI